MSAARLVSFYIVVGVLLGAGGPAGCLAEAPPEQTGGSIDDARYSDCTSPIDLGLMRGDPYCPEFVDWGDPRCSLPPEERRPDLLEIGYTEEWFAFDLVEERWGAVEDLSAYIVLSTPTDDGVDRFRVEARLDGACGATVTPCAPPLALTVIRQMSRTSVRVLTADIPAHDDSLRVLVHVVPIDPSRITTDDSPWWLEVSSLRLGGIPHDPQPSACDG